MENPEKIYLASFDEKPDVLDRTWYWTKQHSCYNTEYTRTDAFIEKACDWIKYNNENGGCLFDGWEEDFKKYMEG